MKQQSGTSFQLIEFGLTVTVALGVISRCKRLHDVLVGNPRPKF